jgi:tyrosyl-tRNA synthetase
MMAKDSVKKRLTGEEREGMSFTEFTYQLIQGYDFYHLWKNAGVKLQMGGSDQWGNITTGTELIRRKAGGEAWALTTPLIKKADGTKFGKTEGGNIWLDSKRTTPYEFYQFWMNAADEDAGNFIRIFTLKTREEIEAIETEHLAAPHLRGLQRALAEDITTRVHSADDLRMAQAATEVLFGKGTIEQLARFNDEQFVGIFVGAGVAVTDVTESEIAQGIGVLDLIADKAGLVASKGEGRKLIQGNGLSINKNKITDANLSVTKDQLINGKYLLLQKGKKDYCLVKVV